MFYYGHYDTGDSDISTAVINESEAEGEEARKFLEDVRTTFPQVLIADILSFFDFTMELICN